MECKYTSIHVLYYTHYIDNIVYMNALPMTDNDLNCFYKICMYTFDRTINTHVQCTCTDVHLLFHFDYTQLFN